MQNKPFKKKKKSTSWEPVENWYHHAVGDEGSYYHKKVILPGLKKMLQLQEKDSLLDIGCGQGILGRTICKGIAYTGVDISPSLVDHAKKMDPDPKHEYLVGDATQELSVSKKDFSHAAFVLCLQNMEPGNVALKNVATTIRQDGILVLVLNHPCFRIPRQSFWGIDEGKKLQYRRMDRYMSSMKIPIQAHPGKGASSPYTISIHHPLSTYCKWLKDAGFTIGEMEEWCSDKVSQGGAAKMENRSRSEFPLFLAIKAVKT